MVREITQDVDPLDPKSPQTQTPPCTPPSKIKTNNLGHNVVKRILPLFPKKVARKLFLIPRPPSLLQVHALWLVRGKSLKKKKRQITEEVQLLLLVQQLICSQSSAARRTRSKSQHTRTHLYHFSLSPRKRYTVSWGDLGSSSTFPFSCFCLVRTELGAQRFVCHVSMSKKSHLKETQTPLLWTLWGQSGGTQPPSIVTLDLRPVGHLR